MKSPKKRPLGRPSGQQEGLPTSKTILHAASKLFIEKGFESVSMNQVAELSGVTKATVYYYFPTKTELFMASMLEVLSFVNERIRTILEQPGSFRSRLVNIATNYLKIPQVHMDGMVEKVRHHLSPEQQESLIIHENALYQRLQEGFDAAVRNEEIICNDSFIAAHIFVSMLKVGERKYTDDNKLFASVEEAAEGIVSFLWRGIHK
ncbi:AcrR family transcriptional regulator [Paenibacillus anaericanus]|uniref:TetR/AcrR family transcriptional regulator n=1 Tax=Paenibacillus anaericanus TaxID=170367 RepID=UPI0027829566|nr:TetR/AcrR family transcriptional regulator [Paenibacillus anaericanus]MDQ0091300.1 AcrR family transcriptional regulator [Paenibacillus anaericanus]